MRTRRNSTNPTPDKQVNAAERTINGIVIHGCTDEIKELMGYIAHDVQVTSDMMPFMHIYRPTRILVSGNATIVFWMDDTKTVVRCAKGETPDLYAAFTAALGIKLYGSNSQLKKVMQRLTVIQKPKVKQVKNADPEPEGAAADVMQEA